jgi:hypothetical protein
MYSLRRFSCSASDFSKSCLVSSAIAKFAMININSMDTKVIIFKSNAPFHNREYAIDFR